MVSEGTVGGLFEAETSILVETMAIMVHLSSAE